MVQLKEIRIRSDLFLNSDIFQRNPFLDKFLQNVLNEVLNFRIVIALKLLTFIRDNNCFNRQTTFNKTICVE
jgi:hypothetical protein